MPKQEAIKRPQESNGAPNHSHEQTKSEKNPRYNARASQKLYQNFETPLNHPQRTDMKSKISKMQRGKSRDDSVRSLPATREQEKRGKKRDRNGKLLKYPGSTSSKAAQHSKISEEPHDDQNDFEAGFQALGGTEEDLTLFANADSDSEMEEPTGEPLPSGQMHSKGQDITKGVSNILKEIALAQRASDKVGEVSAKPKAKKDDRTALTAQKSQTKVSTIRSSQVARTKKPELKCEPRSDWFNMIEVDIQIENTTRFKLSSESVNQLHKVALSLLESENQGFESTQKASSSQSFYKTVITSGTLSDKISALTLAVQDSPIHNMKALGNLLNLARKRSRSQAVDVLSALKDLFAQGSLLPTTRKLYAFATQPALLQAFGSLKTWTRGDNLPTGIGEKHLIIWAFENWLKELYFEILQILETWCNDEIEFSKARAISYVFDLLKERPEQESNLMRLLMNKLGDPNKKIASQTSHLIMRLLEAHPAMKSVAIDSVEHDFIFRPGQSLHSQYYAVITINQTILSSKDEGIALQLLEIYFKLFREILKQQDATRTQKDIQIIRNKRGVKAKKIPNNSVPGQEEELREKLTSAILTGVNRAYPYTGTADQKFVQHLDTLYKIAHSSNFNTSIQALLLIQQLSTSHQHANDRFYRVLYESLLDPRLVHASKQRLYLNLVHKSLKADLNVKRVKAFVKRILQVLSLHEPSFICAVFFLLRDLESTFPALANLIDEAEDHEDEEEVFRDVDDVETPKEVEGQNAENLNTTKAVLNLYDAHKRAPEHANAENTCAWELLPFLAHFHPAVSVSANHVLEHDKLPGKPDLALHSLIHFLDRFVYRNPKLSSSGLRGSSIMQPMAHEDSQAVLLGHSSGQKSSLPVNSDRFRSKKDSEVAAEDAFFHKYFSVVNRESASKKAKKERKKLKANLEHEEGSDNEDEIWNAMVDSAPQLEGAVDSDDDLDMADFDAEIDTDMDSEQSDDHGNMNGEDSDDGVEIEAGIFDDTEDEKEAEDLEGSIDHGFDDFELEDVELSLPLKAQGQEKGNKKNQVSGGKHQRRLKGLPTFASASDYANMLADDDGEDIG